MDRIADEAELDRALSQPSAAVVEQMRLLDGEIMILGAGGKIGPTLAMTAARAVEAAAEPAGGPAAQRPRKRVIGVSRFTEPGLEQRLSDAGVETIVCDLLDEEAVKRLPKVENIIFMAGRKFGTSGSEGLTWAMNAVVPAHVARSFPESRIVVFSTGCVYLLVPPSTGGSRESDRPDPVGEYGWSCLARERIFSHYSTTVGTRVCLFRLNYAIDLRYGVLRDIAERIVQGKPVSLGVPFVNVIWQGDVNNQALRALDLCASPPAVLNVTGPELLPVRELAHGLADRLGRRVTFEAEGGERALLSDASLSVSHFGPPSVPVEQLLDWTADWVLRGGRSLGKPTHFEVSDGRF
ncbi:NAD-dependent epimerase/dehydratase family protein [Salinispira pacifica]